MSVTKPALRQALTKPAIQPRGSEAMLGSYRSVPGLRASVIAAVLFLVPLLAYWPATFHDYGLRDDYSNLREAHEEPGVILKFCASAARPVYGWLLQATYGQTNSVRNLQWMRFAATLLLGALSLVMFRGLHFLGWPMRTSLCFALLLPLVPAAQVIAGWAIGWPYVATALLAVAGFFTVEGALLAGYRAGEYRLARQWILALALMVVSALIYQPSALFYTVPLAAALTSQRQRGLRTTLRWLGLHLGLVVASLGLAYGLMSALYAGGFFVKSGRVAFEQHWGEKLGWYWSEALPNALSMFVLNDNNLRDHAWYIACAALVGLLLLAGLAIEWRRHGRVRGLIWATGLVGLPLFALGISLIAAERYATYRTILAMTAVLLCFLVASVQTITERCSARVRYWCVTLLFAGAFFTAQHHVYALIAVPQGNEWQLILQGAKHVHIDGKNLPRVFVIASSSADTSTATIYHDEFGSLSSNSEWVPKEMFKRAMHDLHPDVVNLASHYDFSTGYKLPAGQRYDVVVDMRRLRQFYIDD